MFGCIQYVISVTKYLQLEEMQHLMNGTTQNSSRTPQNFDSKWTFIESLRASLPSRAICNKLVEFYFNYFENVYRILHIPSFLTEYEAFWDVRSEHIMRFYDFIPQLAAVVGIASEFYDMADSVNITTINSLPRNCIFSLIEE